ncbi:hypothetical protein BBJ28_00002899 [Nothophytophthora sp. Chile5]|nr:hypothetical protein BBJ28_00002899 [Nothophytophthora sp. Chile5]
MAQEDARLPLLLGLAFGQRMLDGQAEWQDVPEVVRTSFLLLAKEMRRLHRLVLAQQQFRDDSPSATPASTADRVHTEDTRVYEMQAELSRLSKWARDAQRLADERHGALGLTDAVPFAPLNLIALWTVYRSADEAETHASVSRRLAANWATAETQLQLMQARMDAFEKEQLQKKKTLGAHDNTTDEALQLLAESQATCSQEIRRLQRALAAHDHRVISSADPLRKPSPTRQSEHDPDPGCGRLNGALLAPKEDTDGPPTQLREPEEPVLEELTSRTHASLRLRYAEARRKQQRGRSEPVADGG